MKTQLKTNVDVQVSWVTPLPIAANFESVKSFASSRCNNVVVAFGLNNSRRYSVLLLVCLFGLLVVGSGAARTDSGAHGAGSNNNYAKQSDVSTQLTAATGFTCAVHVYAGGTGCWGLAMADAHDLAVAAGVRRSPLHVLRQFALLLTMEADLVSTDIGGLLAVVHHGGMTQQREQRASSRNTTIGGAYSEQYLVVQEQPTVGYGA